VSARIDLPARRRSVTHKLKVGGATIYLTVGFYDKELRVPGELFMTVDRAGEQVRTLVDCLARMTSFAIQHGAPLEGCMLQWLGVKGKLRGPVAGDEETVKMAESAVDTIAKHMLIRYCGRDDLKPKMPTKEATDGPTDQHRVD